jgi:hypothetical protein
MHRSRITDRTGLIGPPVRTANTPTTPRKTWLFTKQTAVTNLTYLILISPFFVVGIAIVNWMTDPDQGANIVAGWIFMLLACGGTALAAYIDTKRQTYSAVRTGLGLLAVLIAYLAYHLATPSAGGISDQIYSALGTTPFLLGAALIGANLAK